ncbi:hypothetical protein CC79DRAFT_655427 [Sarocladium strictum]
MTPLLAMLLPSLLLISISIALTILSTILSSISLSILLPLVSFFTDLRGIFPTDGCQRYRASSTFYLLVRPCCWGSDTGCRPLTAGETFVVALDMAGTSNPQSAIRRFPPLITHLYPVPATKARSRPSFLPIFSSPYLQATFLVTL